MGVFKELRHIFNHLGINSKKPPPGAANPPRHNSHERPSMVLVVLPIDFKPETRSQMSEMQSFCTWATSGPPESPWQASIPSSPAQIIVAESAKCFFNIWLKGVNFIPIAPLYALLQSLSLCIGTRAFRGTKSYADEEQTVWLCQQYFSCPRYFLSPAFYAIGSHYPPWGGLWKVVRHSQRFFPNQ